MTAPPMIQRLRRRHIDVTKWDQCVTQAPNGWLYARSFYLDGIGDWDALVISSPETGSPETTVASPSTSSYDFIMPLPTRQRYGIRYVYFPPFIGQLGIISSKPIPEELTNAFLACIIKTYRIADILLNEHNPSPSLASLDIQRRVNYILPLTAAYGTISSAYTADALKNLRRTHNLGLTVTPDIPLDRIIRLYRNAYGEKNLNYTGKDYEKIALVADLCLKKGMGFTLGITDRKGELHAAAFFGIDNKRIYYLLGAPSPEGRKSNATHLLIDEVIKKYAGTGLTFDFEGSDIPSVAAFYRKFDPRTAHYELVRINRLPRWLRRFA